jgi:hypothetical protein
MRTHFAHDGADGGRAAEQHYLVAELSALWGFSAKTIRRLFEDELGVIAVGHEEVLHKRGYRTLSIPESVAKRVHAQLELRQNGLRRQIR